MKRLFVVGVFLNAGLLFALWYEVSAVAQDSNSPVATLNGDVNGSGDIDVADASYLVNWLFLGGSEPVLIVGCPPSGLLDSAPAGRFVDNEDGTVTDTSTGLMWQRDTADTDASGTVNPDDQLFWVDATTYCDNLSFADHDDWRLPNVQELLSLVIYAERFCPIASEFSTYYEGRYWSSTTSRNELAGSVVWSVRFDESRALEIVFSRQLEASKFFVRGVRNAR